MKPIIAITVLLFLTYVATCPAEELTLAWDKNPEVDVIGYRLHLGSQSGNYSRVVNCGDVTEFTLEVDWDKTTRQGADQFVVVTAYNAAGLESPPSNELNFGGEPPSAPKGLKIEMKDEVTAQIDATGPEGYDLIMYTSRDLKQWDEINRGHRWISIYQNVRSPFRQYYTVKTERRKTISG